MYSKGNSLTNPTVSVYCLHLAFPYFAELNVILGYTMTTSHCLCVSHYICPQNIADT